MSNQELSYVDVIVEKDSLLGFLGRRLQTRLLTNVIQGAAFSIGVEVLRDAVKR